MTEVINEIIFEVLKKFQADVASIKATVSDQPWLLVSMREDELRPESMQAETQLRLDCIEERFALRDAE